MYCKVQRLSFGSNNFKIAIRFTKNIAGQINNILFTDSKTCYFSPAWNFGHAQWKREDIRLLFDLNMVGNLLDLRKTGEVNLVTIKMKCLVEELCLEHVQNSNCQMYRFVTDLIQT